VKNKILVKRMFQERDELFNTSYVKQWKTENNRITRCLSDDKNNLICIAFIHKTNGYNNLDYIYTFKNYRRSGHALKLLKQLKNEELCATCNCNESEELFTKAGWILINTIFKSYVTQQKYVRKYTQEFMKMLGHVKQYT